MPTTTYGEGYRFLDSADRLSDDEVVRLASVFVELGVCKLRVTGGEPLLRKDVAGLVSRLVKLPVEDLALTTNGALLDRHAEKLKAAGLSRLTVSVDSLDPIVFSKMSGGRGDIEQVLEGIAAASRAGFAPVKINTVVQRGVNEHTVLDLLDHFRGSGHIVRFIEYMDVGTCNRWRLEEVLPSAELIELIQQRWPLKPLTEQYYGEVAKRYAYCDGQGEIGIVSSVSQPFCGSCTRARLSSDGHFYTCLFAHQGLDLKTPMRSGASDDELRRLIGQCWAKREDRYSELRGVADSDRLKVEMYRLGG
jgi:cyclic pyranopterin phosphate synthase